MLDIISSGASDLLLKDSRSPHAGPTTLILNRKAGPKIADLGF